MGLITNSSRDSGRLHIATAAFSALEANLNRLVWLDHAVVGHVGCGVRIIASDIRIPTVGDFASVRECEGDRPTINRCSTWVADANSGGETRIPFIAQHKLAFVSRGFAAG